MKYVYVLTSTDKDLYYEQCLMSVFSLRHYMREAEIIILTDDKTVSSFVGKREKLKEYASDIVSVTFPENASNVERSRVLKTTIPEHITGDFLFIDCDTIICDSLSDIEQYDYPIAAVLDGHVMLSEHKHRDYFLKREKKMHYTGTAKQGFHINSGVILYRDCEKARAFFKKWNELWKYGAYQKHDTHDQNAFNEANLRTGSNMQELPGEWDCQPSHGGLQYLQNAKIIHYFSSEFNGKQYVPYYKLADKKLQQRIKDTGTILPDIAQMIENAKFQFTDVHLVHDKRIISVMQTPLLFTLADIKAHIPWLFAFFNAQCAFLRWLAKKITGKK